jgi:hypothetical protein
MLGNGVPHPTHPGLAAYCDTRPAPAKRRSPQKYLRGPVHLEWLRRAGLLSRGTLLTGLALWHLRGLRKSATVRLPPSLLEQLGVSRWTASRALVALERAGLVSTERRRGRAPLVTLLDVAEHPEEL